MKALLQLISILAVLLLVQSKVHSQVTWRVSVKFINDANNNRPTNGTITNEAGVQAQIDFANTLPSFAGRGAQLDLVEVLDVFGATAWFNKDPSPSQNRQDLEAAATADPVRYHWRTDAINIYLNNQSAGGCSFPGGGSIIFLGTSNNKWVFIHEIGHFMSLQHTHTGERFENQNGSNCSSNDPCADCFRTIAGNDIIADTLPDVSCWDTRDQIAQGNFNKNWSELSSTDQTRVDNTRYNIMSYHGSRSIFTTLQLDAMCDTSNVDRDIVSHNNFVFVDVLSPGIQANGLSKILPFGGPYHTLKEGIDAAFGSDVLLLRPGNYAENREIRGAITLRAVRRDVLTPGNAIIRAQ